MATTEDISGLPALTESQFLTVMDEDNLSINSLAPSTASSNYPTSHYRAEVEKRLEAKRRAEMEACTFKPKLYAYKSERNNEDADSRSRFDKLYEEARRRQSKPPPTQPDANELTFHPSINSRPSSRGRRSPSPTSEVVARLSQTRKSVPEPELPSFTPKITKRASSTERRHEDIADRLIQKAEAIKGRLIQKREEQAAAVIEQCTFAPKLNATSTSLVTKRRASASGSEGENRTSNVSERLLRYQEDRAKRLEHLRQAKESVEMAQVTFQPNLSSSRSHSRSSTPTRTTNVVDLVERLSAHKIATDAPDDRFTFKPQINELSKALVDTSATASLPVHERLLQTAQAKKQEWDHLMEQIQDEDRKRKVPRVNSRPTSSSPSVDGGASLDSNSGSNIPVFERLSKQTQKQQLGFIMSQLKDELEMSNCTFHPVVRGTSVVGGTVAVHHENVPIFDRLNAEAQQIKVAAEKREKLRQMEEMKDATFQPKLVDSHLTARNRDSTPIHIRLNAEAERLKKEAAKREELKREEELKGVTFQPVVKGLTNGSKRTITSTVHDRLNSEADKLRERQRILKENRLKEVMQGHTFTPEVSKVAKETNKSYLWWNSSNYSGSPAVSQSTTRGRSPSSGSDSKGLVRRSSSASRASPSSSSAARQNSSSGGKARSSSATRASRSPDSAGSVPHSMLPTEAFKAHHQPEDHSKITEGVIGAGIKSNQISHHAELETVASRYHHDAPHDYSLDHHHVHTSSPRANRSNPSTPTTQHSNISTQSPADRFSESAGRSPAAVHVSKRSASASPRAGSQTPSKSTVPTRGAVDSSRGRSGGENGSISRTRSSSVDRAARNSSASTPGKSIAANHPSKSITPGRIVNGKSANPTPDSTSIIPAAKTKQHPTPLAITPTASTNVEEIDVDNSNFDSDSETFSPVHVGATPWAADVSSPSKIPVLSSSPRPVNSKLTRSNSGDLFGEVGTSIATSTDNNDGITPRTVNAGTPRGTSSIPLATNVSNGSSGRAIDRQKLKQQKHEQQQQQLQQQLQQSTNQPVISVDAGTEENCILPVTAGTEIDEPVVEIEPVSATTD